MSTDPRPDLPVRPLLHPGVRVCPRGDGHLQIGLDPRLRLVAPDQPGVRALLGGLRDGLPPGAELGPTAARVYADLLDRGLVVEAEPLLRELRADIRPAERASTVARHCETTASARARRARTRVAVEGPTLPDAAAVLRRRVAGLGLTEATQCPDVVVLLTLGELARAELDDLVRRGVPHLLVACSEGVVRLGPFVDPSRTACLRCIDAAHAERDPRRALVLEQYAERPRSRSHPPDPIPEPIPGDLLDLALVWAARDVAGWAEGHRPRTWSSTLVVDPRLELEPVLWKQHPGCGCGWELRFAG